MILIAALLIIANDRSDLQQIDLFDHQHIQNPIVRLRVRNRIEAAAVPPAVADADHGLPAREHLAAVQCDGVIRRQPVQHVRENGQDVRALPAHERQALEAGDIRADPRVKPDGKNVQRIRIVAADEIKARLLRVQQTLNGGEGGGIVKNFDCVVAGAAGKMRHGSVAIAHDTVYNFVERSVAAAGVQAHFFAGLRRLPRQRPAFAGRVGDKQFIA